jgi:hypothetical protein
VKDQRSRHAIRLGFRPGPSQDVPAGWALLQGKGKPRTDFLFRLALDLEVVVAGDDDIGTIAGDVSMQRFAERRPRVYDPRTMNASMLRARRAVVGPSMWTKRTATPVTSR